MKISESLTKKKLLWLVGTLLLGALGSGLWEAIIKPSMLWFGTLMLDVGTLGLSSLRDDMYTDIAKGTYERAGVMLLSIGTGILCGLLTSPLILGLMFRNRDDIVEPRSSISRVMSTSWVLAAVPLALTMIFFVGLFRVGYTVRASNYADQLIRITNPYVTEQDRLIHESQLAQISTREDYVQIITKLRKIAAINKTSIPEFSIY